MGSTYVPLDGWFYPAFDRLAALGYVQTGFAGLRPWTRMECARLVQEAGGLIEQQGLENGEAVRLYRALAQEFAPEMARWDGASNRGAEVESIYTRFMGISGTPLTDGYHFGQTITNDFGRPYGEGLNTITGFSSRAEAGPLAFYVRGEYQHAPALAPVPDNVQAAIAANDQNPLVLAAAPTTTNRFQLLDSYLSFGFSGFQISAGRQSLWWGPGQGGPLLWSDNAEPIAMVRLSRTFPIKLPSIFSLLGPMRTRVLLRQAGRPSLSAPPLHPWPKDQLQTYPQPRVRVLAYRDLRRPAPAAYLGNLSHIASSVPRPAALTPF